MYTAHRSETLPLTKRHLQRLNNLPRNNNKTFPPRYKPRRTSSLNLNHNNQNTFLQIPSTPTRIYSNRIPPGRANQTPTRLTSLALKVHNQKQSQIYRG